MNNNQGYQSGGCCLDVDRLIAVVASQVGGATGPTGPTHTLKSESKEIV